MRVYSVDLPALCYHATHVSLVVKGILYDIFIVILEQIIVLTKLCTYNKPIPKISELV